MDSKKLAQDNFEFVVAMRREFHENPEASFEEFRTTDRIAEELDKIGIPYRRFEPTGLIGEIKGAKPGITVGLRADIDALSIQEKTDVEFKSKNDGFMHACGHDTHGAMLLGAAKALYDSRDELKGTVKLIFQPAEEVARGARKIIEQGALDGVDYIFALHIMAQMPVGLIAVGDGPSTSAADVFNIKLKGVACHGAMPETGVDATVAASALVLNLQSIVSRELSPMDNVVVTVGKLTSGTRFNIVSGEAEMEGTVRTFDREVHDRIPGIMERIAKETAATYRCEAELEYTNLTDVLINDPKATTYSQSAAEKVANSPELVQPLPKLMGAEDFAEYTAKAKAGFIALGGGGEHPQHSDYFWLDEEAFKTGVAWLVQVTYDCLEDNA